MYFWFEIVASSCCFVFIQCLVCLLAAWNEHLPDLALQSQYICSTANRNLFRFVCYWQLCSTNSHCEVFIAMMCKPEKWTQNKLEEDSLQAALFGSWNWWLWNIHAQSFWQAFLRPSFKFYNLSWYVFLWEPWNTPYTHKAVLFPECSPHSFP